MATPLVKWKEYDGMEFLFVSYSGPGAYVSNSEPTQNSNKAGPDKTEKVKTVTHSGSIHTASKVHAGNYQRAMRGRASKTIPSMRSPTFSGPVKEATTTINVKTTTTHSTRVRAGQQLKGTPSGGEAIAEVAMRTSVGLMDWSVRYALWNAIEGMESPIIRAIREYGGVLIVGRIIKWDHPEPVSGAYPTLFKDAYLSDAGPSYDSLFAEAAERDTSGKTYIGARRHHIGASKFPGPDTLEVPKHWVQDHIKVWARKARNSNL